MSETIYCPDCKHDVGRHGDYGCDLCDCKIHGGHEAWKLLVEARAVARYQYRKAKELQTELDADDCLFHEIESGSWQIAKEIEQLKSERDELQKKLDRVPRYIQFKWTVGGESQSGKAELVASSDAGLKEIAEERDECLDFIMELYEDNLETSELYEWAEVAVERIRHFLATRGEFKPTVIMEDRCATKRHVYEPEKGRRVE
jgi:hypothetical protein